MYEGDFESLLLAHASELYPQFWMVPFKKTVTSDYGNAQADLALIDHLYRAWWVVEVELSTHSLSGHVEPQVSCLATAEYGPDEASYLARKNAALDPRRLTAMMLGEQPRVLVLVNDAKPDWVTSLRRWDVLVGVVEVFRSQQNREILRVNGEHPHVLGDVLSLCHVDPLMPRCLVVESPGALGLDAGESATLFFEGDGSEWRRIDVANKVWLMAARRYPLPPELQRFKLLRRGDGRLALEPRLPRKKR